THRQLEVLRLMAQGTTVGRIADSLGVSIHTVRSHIQRILEKLDAHSQAEAVARAFRERLL
ncbi:MAG: LuxR C-terminal-related transcriptional regulator, partial [Thermoanaerobaculia bacterium]